MYLSQPQIDALKRIQSNILFHKTELVQMQAEVEQIALQAQGEQRAKGMRVSDSLFDSIEQLKDVELSLKNTLELIQ